VPIIIVNTEKTKLTRNRAVSGLQELQYPLNFDKSRTTENPSLLRSITGDISRSAMVSLMLDLLDSIPRLLDIFCPAMADQSVNRRFIS
jgi:hypothetical protein